MGRHRDRLQRLGVFYFVLVLNAADSGGCSLFAGEPPAQDAPAGERSRALIRREAEAARRAREAAFDRLRKLPPAPENPDLIMRQARMRLDVVQRNGVRRVWVRLEPQPGENEDDADEPEGAVNAQRPRRPRPLVPASYFDDLFFGGGKEADIRDRLLVLLKRRIKYLNETYALTPAQQQKLLLAGKGDLKRLFDEVQDERRLFEEARTDEDRLRKFFQDVAGLRFRLSANLFDGQSLFSKTFLKMRAEKQLVRRHPEPSR